MRVLLHRTEPCDFRGRHPSGGAYRGIPRTSEGNLICVEINSPVPMKPPTGKQIGEDLLLNHCPELLTNGKPKLRVFRAYLAHLESVIPKSVFRAGIQSQLLWIYEVFRKGIPDDPRASLPKAEIIEELIIHLRLPRKAPHPQGFEVKSLTYWAQKKKTRANAKGGRARAKKAERKICEECSRLDIQENVSQYGTSWREHGRSSG